MQKETLLSLPPALHAALIAPHLSDRDLCALQLSSRALRSIYQRQDVWEQRVRNFPTIPEYVFDHPDFGRFKFDYRRLYSLLISGGRGLANQLTQTVEPWQFAALLGEEEQLLEVYGDVIPDLRDDEYLGVVDFYVLGDQQDRVLAWIKKYPQDYYRGVAVFDRLPIIAATGGRIAMLERLAQEYRFDLKQIVQDDSGDCTTLLHTAVMHGQRKMMHWLIKLGVPYKLDHSLVLLAARCGQWEIYSDLMALGLCKPFYESCYQSVIINAIAQGNKAVYEATAKEANFDIPTFSPYEKKKYFSSAISSGNIEMALCALNEKAPWGSVEERFESNVFENGETVLHLAICQHNIALVEELLQRYPDKLDPKMTDNSGNNLLHRSAECGVLPITMQLYHKYFAPSELIAPKKTKFSLFAKLQRHKSIAQGPSEADILFQPNKLGETIVHLAAKNRHHNYLHLLRKKFGDEPFKARDNHNNTVLHHACYNDSIGVKLWLINNVGLSLKAVNKDGDTPLHVLTKRALSRSIDYSNFEGLLLELDYSFIVNYKNKEGNTVADLILKGETEVLKDILDDVKAHHQEKKLRTTNQGKLALK